MDTNLVGIRHTRTGKSRKMIDDLADCILIIYMDLTGGQEDVICRWPGLKPAEYSLPL